MSVAAVTLAGGAIVAMTSAPAAHAATVACGSYCVDIFYEGSGVGDIVSVDSGTTQAGLGTTVAGGGNYSAEDFMQTTPTLVSVYYNAGIVSRLVDENWGNDYAYQFEYAPNGDGSGLCLGVAAIASPGEDVTLQQCGVDANTLWIGVSADRSGGYVPMVNGTDTSASAPEVLTATVDLHEFPYTATVVPAIEALYQFDGTWSTSQMWTDEDGPF
jgi:hypothetical protein